ncbi:MAG: AlwI family type II restriction endonuclease [Candidatus Hepatoplasma vulgare]|nr:MAG: AlwI family type II restriction endonuclease [Candidatus Hepatoplasma sp.]
MKLIAIKFGQSEHKRVNYLNFYFAAALSFQNLIGIKINNIEKINKEFLKNEVYEIEKKETNIKRELTFFKNGFPLYFENKNKEIEVTNLTKKILENGDKKIFNGRTYLENVLILYLIKKYPENEIINNPFFCALNFAEEEKYTKKEFIDKIFKLNKEKIQNYLEQISLDDYINIYFKFKSGNPESKKDLEIKKFQNKKNELIEELARNVLSKKNNQEIVLNKLYILINEYMKLRDLKKISIFPKTFKKIFQLKDSDLYKFILDYEKKDKQKYFDLIKNMNFNYLIENFYFENKKGDYGNLIWKYLINTNFFLIKEDKISINPKCEEYINDLKNNYYEILKIKLDDKNIIEKFKNLNIKNKDNNDISVREIINEYYNENFYNNFFEIISLEDEKIINKKLIKLGNENQHINGILDAPTIFEFIINLFFFKLFYKEEILNINKISDEELTNNFKESINTYLTSNLIPQRFASGGRSDAIFKNQEILIEPTLQIKRQVKHELNSITDHLKKVGYHYSVLVAPKISNDFLPQVISYKDYDYSWIILPFNTNILIKIKESDYSTDLFNEIKNDFKNCNTYKEVSNIFKKYNN